MLNQIFRQYDIRAKIGSELAIEEIYGLTQAIAAYFLIHQPATKTIAVGADGRIHSPAIKQEMCRALRDSGLDVIFIGVCPTPVLYFALFTLNVDAGLMITASHNGKEYNGIKICLGRESVWGDEIKEISRLYQEKNIVRATLRGTYQEHPLIPEYVAWLKNHFSDLIGMETSYVVDCGNGAAGTVLPLLLREFSWKNVLLLYPEVDGTYPNHEADPTVPKNMEMVKHVLQTTDTSCGIGLDGDCDRMAPMTKSGKLLPGDTLLALFAQPILQQHPGARVVFDIKCSAQLPKLLSSWGGVPVISPSGHSIIKNQMRKTGALLAGELSCHFFFKDSYFGYDDGIYAMMRLMQLIKNAGKSLDELITIVPQSYATPEIRIACKEEDKDAIIAALKSYFDQRTDVQMMTIDGIRVAFDHGWFLVRVSNTQPMICVRIEADDQGTLTNLKELLIKLLASFFSAEQLKREFNEE
jgi:phosphomannomutase / phosphoglucomutase